MTTATTTARRGLRRPILVLVGAFLGLSVLGGAAGAALGATGAASSSFEQGDAGHHGGFADRDGPDLQH